MDRFTRKLVDAIDAISEFVGLTISWLSLAMMVVTCIIVASRYIFNLGSIALQETVVYMHGIVFMLGIAYTLKHQGHVRVDIFYGEFSVRKRALVDLIGALIFLLPVGLFLFFSSLNYVSFAWSLGESSAQPGGLPGVYLLKTLIPLMAFLLVLQGIAEIGRAGIVLFLYTENS
ncbi:MAG: TRAP transporter small permease subunit [Pseudomonadales bacterium]|jgi:TRAP-type mannitol/chloroaromatic compound transport system permease small subunit